MINKKIISLGLSVTLFLGTLNFVSNTKPVYASELNNTSIPNNNENSDSILKKIEENYLYQREDGTFYISDDAYNVIDNDTIDFFKDQINEINSLILDNQLEFKIEKMDKGTNVKNIKADVEESIMTRSVDSGNILSSYTYCSDYEWHWWGYSTTVNKQGSEYLLNYVEREAAVYGALCGLAAVIPGGAIGAAVAAVGGTITYGTAIAEFKNGIVSEKGVRATGVGKPSNGNLIKVSAIY